MSSDRLTIPFEEAVKLLPEGESIHTFMNPAAAVLVVADWSRARILQVLHQAEEIHVTGEQAQAMGHGLCVKFKGDWLFIKAAEYQVPT